MKIRKLKFENFGPYKNYTEINFDNFKKETLVLIHGRTGAGKSTILDAIIYALYGQLSDPYKDSKNIISDYKKLDKECFVEIIFTINNKKIKILRKPEQRAAKKRGEGSVIRKAEVSIFEFDKEWILKHSGLKESNIYIENLLGIDASQFRQMIILPQGRFREMLNASSDSREKLLSQIFDTYFLDSVISKLKSEKELLEDEYKKQLAKKEWFLERLKRNKELIKLNIDFKCEENKIEEIIENMKNEKSINNRKLNEINNNIREIGILIQKQSDLEKEYNILKQKIKDFDILKKNLNSMEDKRKKINEFDEYRDLIDLYEKKNQIEEDLNRINNKYKELLLKIENIKNEEKKIIVIENEIKEFKQKKEKYNKENDENQIALEKVGIYNKLSDELIKLEEEIAKRKLDERKYEKEIENYKEYTIKLKLCVEEEIKLNEEINILNKKIDEYVDKSELKKKSIELLDQIKFCDEDNKKLNNAFNKVIIIKENFKKKYDIEFEKYIDNQAGFFASRLEENKRCPVCGSIEHPIIAKKVDGVLDRKELNDIKNKLSEHELEANKLDKKISINNQKINSLNDILNDILLKIDIDTEYDKKLIKLRENQNSLTEKKKENRKIIDMQEEKELKNSKIISYLEKIKEDIKFKNDKYQEIKGKMKSYFEKVPDVQVLIKKDKKIKSLILEIAQLIDDKNNYITQFNNNKHTILGNFEEVKSQKFFIQNRFDKIIIEYENMFKQKSALEENLRECLKIKEIYLLYKNECENYFREYDLLKRSISEYQNRTKEYDEKIILKYNEKEKILKDKYDYYNLRDGELKQSLAELKEYNDFLENEKKLSKDRDMQFGYLTLFYDALNGNNPKGLSLRRYILRTKFEEVLDMANVRLANMSQNRFQLFLSEERMDKRKKWGLDLSVEDSNTGRLRPVNTLSGGEGFMAALSLALGLSDVVESYSGGVWMDTLFIDEGFGSLDTESLDRAITTLQNLKENGRFIGVISHVEELKERIPSRIEVVSSIEGSKLKIIS